MTFCGQEVISKSCNNYFVVFKIISKISTKDAGATDHFIYSTVPNTFLDFLVQPAQCRRLRSSFPCYLALVFSMKGVS